MTQMALVLAIGALTIGAVTLLLLWRRGFFASPIPTQQPLVEMPTVILTHDLAPRSRCGENSFRGHVDVELIYISPAGLPNAQVTVTLSVHRRDNVTVTLARTDLGTFQNDTTQSIRFDGALVDPCSDGDFTILATIVSTGPRSTTTVEGERVRVDSLDYTVSMPHHVSAGDDRRFTLDVTIDCCGKGPPTGIVFTGVTDVEDLAANPARFRCGQPGPARRVTITGKKTDMNRVGVFTVEASAGGATCMLGAVQVE